MGTKKGEGKLTEPLGGRTKEGAGPGNFSISRRGEGVLNSRKTQKGGR